MQELQKQFDIEEGEMTGPRFRKQPIERQTREQQIRDQRARRKIQTVI